MSWISQTTAVTGQSLRSLPQRRGNAIVAVIGVAGVVAVFVAVLSIAAGFSGTMAASGSDRSVIVLRDGSSSEIDSGLSADQVQIMKDAPGLARDGSGAVASGEIHVVVDLKKKSTGTDANVPFRGVELPAFAIRDGLEIVAGRRFESGRMELIAGRGAASQFEGLAVGSTLRMGQAEWTVVGHFEADGGIAESELWADVRVLQPAYRRGNGFNSFYAELVSPDAFREFADALAVDPRLGVEVMREREYFAEQSEALAGFVSGAGWGIALLMALGAAFGAINTMYTSVAERGREIATLKALGFSGGPIVVSVLVEALLL